MQPVGGEGSGLHGPAHRGGVDCGDSFPLQADCRSGGLHPAGFGQAVLFIVRFSVTDKNDSHFSFPPVPIHFKICFGLYHERPGFESDPAGKTNPGREMIPDGIGRPFFS
jgi:hypothetical protein